MSLTSVLTVLVGTVVIGALALVYGRHRWARDTADLCGQLQGARAPLPSTAYDPSELAGLPAPARRYLASVLDDGQPVATSASVTHSGWFNLDQSGDRWVPFTSRQVSVMCRPGFLWNARIRVAPGIDVFVHDGYVEGAGVLRAKGTWPYWRGTIEELVHRPSANSDV